MSAFRPLTCKVEEVNTTIRQHLAKEEEQLIPLLIQHFTPAEQASMIAQFLFCIPMNSVRNFMDWLLPFNRCDLTAHMKATVSDELLLSLLMTWMEPSPEAIASKGGNEEVECDDVDLETSNEEDRAPLGQIANFHRSIGNCLDTFILDAKAVLNSEIAGVRMEPLLAKHRFLKDVCRFHMLSEEEIMFPALSQYTTNSSSEFDKCHIEHTNEGVWFDDLGRLLTDARSTARRGSKEAKDLLNRAIIHAEDLRSNLGSHMLREEQEVFPLLQEKLDLNEQCLMVWRTLKMMPLRLLERVMPWISSQLSESEYRGLQIALEIGGNYTRETSVMKLLSKWAQQGYMRKQNSKLSAKRSRSESDLVEPCKKLDTSDENPILVAKSNPVDHIFQFHRALRRDFRIFESETSELVKSLESNIESWIPQVQSLKGRFTFLWSLYEAHSKTEDEVMFPALESKEATRNTCHSYMMDHKQEEELFETMREMIEELLACSSVHEAQNLAVKLNRKCAAVRSSLEIHVRAEETELWPLFAEHFTIEEQQRIVGDVIGRTGAEVLQIMLPWVSAVFTPTEEDAMMDSLHQATKNTNFETWMQIWRNPELQGSTQAGSNEQQGLKEVVEYLRSRECSSKEFTPSFEDIFRMNQAQLQDAVRQVSNDESLEPKRKSYLIQHIMASQYIISQQSKSESHSSMGSQHFKQFATEDILGCPHYHRNCALLAPCCGKFYICRLCHDEEQTHKLDRYSVKEIMCMKCGTQQQVSNSCISCKVQFGRYYCSICRLYENRRDRAIYHCPFCNVCRRGKGLGIDFYHCMECNACMHTSLYNKHICRQQKMECNCPICKESLFDTSLPIRVSWPILVLHIVVLGVL
eukprot:g7380.t1